MGWNISHGTDQHGQMRRSGTSMGQIGEQIAHVLPVRDWRKVRHLFDRPSGDPFTIPAAEASRIAPILRTAASHRRMPADWASDTNLLADCAERAAAADQSWEWR